MQKTLVLRFKASILPGWTWRRTKCDQPETLVTIISVRFPQAVFLVLDFHSCLEDPLYHSRGIFNSEQLLKSCDLGTNLSKEYDEAYSFTPFPLPVPQANSRQRF